MNQEIDKNLEKRRIDALQYLMVFKEKHTGQIYARGCADWHKQRLQMQKKVTGSPMVALESSSISATIDAYKRWDRDTTSIQCAFMKPDMIVNVANKLLEERRQ